MAQLPDGDVMFNGVHAVLYAMFQRGEQIDPGAMAAQVDYCIEHGCHGITVLGLATEVLKLTPSERQRMVEIVGRAVDGRRPYSVTVAGNSVFEQTELVRAAETNAADWLILQPPMVGSYSAGVYLDFFERVASASSLPFAIQNAPQYLGRGLSEADIAQLLSRCSTFAAVKSEESALGASVLKHAAGNLAVLGGRGGLEMTDSLRAGCCGFVLAPDIAPVAVHIYNAWISEDFEMAERLYSAMLPAVVFSIQSLEHLITYGKRILAAQAGLEVFDRAPNLEPSETGLKWARHWADALSGLAVPDVRSQPEQKLPDEQ